MVGWGARIIGEMAEKLPDNHQPPDQPTLMLPRLIELCFQTAGIWEMGTTSRMGLPSHIRHVSPSNGHSERRRPHVRRRNAASRER